MEPPLIMDPVSLNTTEAADPVPVSQAQVRMIYGRRSSLLLGGTQIGVGLAVLMVNLVIRSTYDGYDGGRLIVYETIAYLAAGITGLAAAVFKKKRLVVAFMMCSLFSTAFATYGFIGSVDVAYDMHNADETAVLVQQRNDRIGLEIARIILYAIEFVASIWSAAVCYKAVGKTRCRGPELVQSFAQLGIAVVEMDTTDTAL